MQRVDWRVAGVKKGVMNDRFQARVFGRSLLAHHPLERGPRGGRVPRSREFDIGYLNLFVEGFLHS
ncbi:hypothetical protein BDV36DRAFT_252971 [Aspergillus pseudocaelatus]|uniref:Uncharacterized protein n=1 Tax=Aspergillus pseudocaelatus TaxID=1825620 RepID=A0ABQ6WP59_9EURO|nr:hypothetical protein BDV36DRAFT_252971 [Aspergillus pseudocaelatus]